MQPRIEVTKRSVYEYGKRKRVVYDARSGPFDATASTAKEARALVARDMAYCEKWRSAAPRRGNCELAPNGHESWCFTLRTHEPWRSSSMLFTASTDTEAYERVWRDFADHEDAQAFIAMSKIGEV